MPGIVLAGAAGVAATVGLENKGPGVLIFVKSIFFTLPNVARTGVTVGVESMEELLEDEELPPSPKRALGVGGTRWAALLLLRCCFILSTVCFIRSRSPSVSRLSSSSLGADPDDLRGVPAALALPDLAA